MLPNLSIRPQEADYAESYGKYVKLVPEGDILSTLSRQLDATLALLASIPEAQGNNRYAPDKWSLKEVLGHIVDAERIFSYRALRFARNDQTPLPRFEIEDYVRNGGFSEQRLSDLAEGFQLGRRANVHFFKHLDSAAWLREGVANGKKASVRALAYIIAGHETHHIQIIRAKYL
ncbi:MAG TPA: DinB family protein [Pyrinomonadaceae bacterium]|nr:DinB family protein [Pyrinomonadaceae bacterium]